MGTIRVSELKPGKKLNRDIFYDGGPIFSSGDVITEEQLKKLRDWGIDEGEIEGTIKSVEELYGDTPVESVAPTATEPGGLPPGRFIERENGKTYLVENNVSGLETSVDLDGDLEVHGNVESGARLNVRGDIRVKGYIGEAEVICSGKCVVEGGINGENVGWIESEFLETPYARDCELKIGGVLKTGLIEKCRVDCGEALNCTEGKGLISRSRVEAGDLVLARFFGEDRGDSVEIIIRDDKMKRWVRELLEVEAEIRQELPNYKRLEKMIAVIRTMGDKVRSLPQDKKEQLAVQTKLYLDLDKKMKEFRKKETLLNQKIRDRKDGNFCNVIALDTFNPGVSVEISGVRHLVMSSTGRGGFFTKSGTIEFNSKPTASKK